MGDYPDELWLADELRGVTSNPSGWLIVEEHFFSEAKHGGRGCVLVDAAESTAALEGTTWIGRDLGKTSVWDDERFANGLETTDRDLTVEFFVHARRPSGASLPVIEISYPFLWYWDAFPNDTGWRYVNEAGKDQELVRWERSTDDEWKVEVRALEFRQFLAAYGRHAIVQLDLVSKMNSSEFERVDDEFENEWAHASFHALYDRSMGDRPASSGLLGQYSITGLGNARVPRYVGRLQDRDYPPFIYGLNPETGQPQTHTCDPDQLGTYFDEDRTRLHYLTPIYFTREVLQPYASEPTKYRISSSRLSCLDLWGLDISFNSVGLVEVYLGDLGQRLPSDEWGHWRSYNVLPEGEMDEGRFRRDFLGQSASSKDIVGDLRRAREATTEPSEKLLGAPIWKRLHGDIKAEFESLIGPLNEDPASLGAPLLVLTKALVDGIDSAPLKSHLQAFDKGDQSLRLLSRYASQLGDTSDITAILRELQRFRSKGGIAHLAGSRTNEAKVELGISGLSNLKAFESIVERATACLTGITQLLAEALRTLTPELTAPENDQRQ